MQYTQLTTAYHLGCYPDKHSATKGTEGWANKPQKCWFQSVYMRFDEN